MFKLFRRKPYSIKVRGRDTFDYREDEKSVSVYREWLNGGPHDMTIHFNEVLGWGSPPDAPPWTSEDRERIRANIAEAFKRLRIKWV
jgi:hypothetical protein